MTNKNNVFKTLLLERPHYIVLAVMIFLVFLNSLFRHFNPDEFESIHTAWKILSGKFIYTGFFQHHHPFFYYTIVPVIQLCGENITSILMLRMLIFVLLIFILIFTYKIAYAVFEDKDISIYSIVFLSSIILFLRDIIAIRPDIPQVLFGLIAIYFLVLSFKTRPTKHLIWSALALAVSFLFLQKAILLIGIIFILLIIRACFKKITIRQFLIYWISFILILSPYYIYLAYTGKISEYIFFNWILNIYLEETVLPFSGIYGSFFTNILQWTFFLTGIFLCKRYVHREFACLVLLLFFPLLISQAPHSQYYLPFWPLMAIIAGYGIKQLISNKTAVNYIVIIGAIFPILSLKSAFINNGNEVQLDKIAYVLSHTNQNDYVYDGECRFNVFRKDIDYFWFSIAPKCGGLVAYKKLRPYNFNTYESIEKFKPKIISNSYINMNNKVIRNNYHMSDKYTDIFVRNN